MLIQRAKRHRRPVGLKLLVARLNRRLAERGWRAKAPPGRAVSDSPYYIVDMRKGCMVEEDIGLRRLEQLAPECGAIEPWEELQRPYCAPPPPEDDDE
jgi:hypothetical protein